MAISPLNLATNLDIVLSILQVWFFAVLAIVTRDIATSYMRDHNTLIPSVFWWAASVACFSRVVYLIVGLLILTASWRPQ